MLLASLVLALQTPPPELDLAFTAPVATVQSPSEINETIAGGSLVVSAALDFGGGSTVIQAFSDEGELLWNQSLVLGEQGEFADLLLSENQLRVVVLHTFETEGQRGWRAFGLDATDGRVEWDETLALVPLADGWSGQMDERSGVLAVVFQALQSNLPNSPSYRSELHVLSVIDGQARVPAEVIEDQARGVRLAPGGSLAILWGNDGRLDAFDTTSGGLSWSVVEPLAPSADRVFGLTFDGAGVRFARADGQFTQGFQVSDGALQWTYANLGAKDVVDWGNEFFFVCSSGNQPISTGPSSVGYALLNGFNGLPVWSGSAPDTQGPFSNVQPAYAHAAVNPQAGRIAFRDTSLFVLDAASGALLDRSDYVAGANEDSRLYITDSGNWVSSSPSQWSLAGNLVEAKGPGAVASWSKTWSLSSGTAELFSVDARAQGSQVHTVWGLSGNPPGWPGNGRYEIYSAESGELESSWLVPFELTSFGSQRSVLEASPSGAVVGALSAAEPDVPIRVFDAGAGTLFSEAQLDSDVDVLFDEVQADLEWSSLSQVAAAWIGAQGLEVAILDDTDGMQWNAVLDAAPNLGKPMLSFSEAGDVLFLFYTAQVAGVWEVRGLRLDATNGAVLGSFTWSDGIVGFSPGYQFLAAQLRPGGLGHYLLLEARGFDTGRVQLLEVPADPWSVAVSNTLVPEGFGVNYEASGVSFAPSLQRLALLGAKATDPGAPGIPMARLGVFELPSGVELHSRDFLFNDTDQYGAVVYLEESVLAVRVGAPFGSHFGQDGLSLVDAETGEFYATSSNTAIQGLQARVVTGGRSALVVVSNPTPSFESQNLQFERFDKGTLLSYPDSVDVDGGDVEFALNLGTQHAGEIYLLLGSATGFEPGTPFGGQVVPLVFDPYTRDTAIFAGTGPWKETIGVLDPSGSAVLTLGVPPYAPEFVGVEAYHAALVFDVLGDVTTVTQPTELLLGP